MSIGYRIFVVNKDNTIEKISQKSFNDFYFKKKPTLLKFADRLIDFAIVFYELVNGVPDKIMRVDSQRIKIKKDGSLDEDHYMEALDIGLNRDPSPNKKLKVKLSGSVLDANILFDERRWKQLHPSIPGPVQTQILKSLFGNNF